MVSKVGSPTLSISVFPLPPNKQGNDRLSKALQDTIQMAPKAPQNPLSVHATNLTPPSPKKGFIENIKERIIKGTLAVVVDKVLDTEKDKKIIQNLLSQPEADRLYNLINQIIPYLKNPLNQLLPSLTGFFNDQPNNAEDPIFRCVIHILANLAKNNGGKTAEELIENCVAHLFNHLGPEFNEIEKAVAGGKPLLNDLFIPLSKSLFDLLFPSDGWIYTLKPLIVPEMVEAIADRYKGQSDNSGAASPFQYEIDHFVPLALEKVADYYIEKDKNFLNQLTKCDDFYLLIEKYTPFLSNKIIPKFNLPLDKMGLKGKPDIIEKTVKAVILRSLVNLSEGLFNKITTVTPQHFIQKVVSHISDELLLVCQEVDPKQNVPVDHFYEVSYKLAKLFLPKKRWLKGFIKLKKEQFLKPVAQMHHSFYLASYNKEVIKSYKARLGKVLKDPKKPKEDVGPIVDQLYHLMSHLASFAKDSLVKDYLQSDAVLQTFDSGMHDLFGDKKNWLGLQIDHMGATRAFLALVCLLENVTKDKWYPIEELFFKAFELLLKKGEDQINVLTGSGEDNPFSEKSLAPAIKELIALFSEKTLTGADLTLPEQIEKMAMEAIQAKSQSSISKILVLITSWTRDRKGSEEKLEALFQSKNMLRICNLGQHSVTQGIPYYLNCESDKIIDDFIMPKLAKLSKSDMGECQTLRAMIQGFLNECGKNPSPEKQKLIQFIGVFFETASVRLLGNLFTRIDAGDSLLEDIVILGVEEATLHFEAIGATKQAVNNPSRKDFIQEFENRNVLHPALQDATKKENFFKELGDKVFTILDIDKNEVPIPDFIKGHCFKMFEELLLPYFLKNTTKHLCDAGTINKILLSILNHVIEENALEPSLLQKLFPDNKTHKIMMANLDPKFNDAYQTELQQELAKAIESLIKMHPDIIPNLLMRSDSIKAFAAEAVGQPLREQIRDAETNTPLSLLEIIDKVAGSYVDEIAPGKSDEATGNFVYYKTSLEGKIRKDDSGSPIESDAPNLSRYFPKPMQKTRAEDFKKAQKKSAMKNVPRLLRQIIDHQTDQIAIKAFTKFWPNFEKKLMDKMVDWFGNQCGKRISCLILPIIRLLMKYPIALGILIFNYSIWVVVSPILKLAFNSQAEKRAKDVAVDIHDNAVLRITEQVIDRYAKAL